MPREAPVKAICREDWAAREAEAILLDAEILGAFEAGLLGVPDDVAAILDARLRRVRFYHEADDVSVLRGAD